MEEFIDEPNDQRRRYFDLLNRRDEEIKNPSQQSSQGQTVQSSSAALTANPHTPPEISVTLTNNKSKSAGGIVNNFADDDDDDYFDAEVIKTLPIPAQLPPVAKPTKKRGHRATARTAKASTQQAIKAAPATSSSPWARHTEFKTENITPSRKPRFSSPNKNNKAEDSDSDSSIEFLGIVKSPKKEPVPLSPITKPTSATKTKTNTKPSTKTTEEKDFDSTAFWLGEDDPYHPAEAQADKNRDSQQQRESQNQQRESQSQDKDITNEVDIDDETTRSDSSSIPAVSVSLPLTHYDHNHDNDMMDMDMEQPPAAVGQSVLEEDEEFEMELVTVPMQRQTTTVPAPTPAIAAAAAVVSAPMAVPPKPAAGITTATAVSAASTTCYADKSGVLNSRQLIEEEKKRLAKLKASSSSTSSSSVPAAVPIPIKQESEQQESAEQSSDILPQKRRSVDDDEDSSHLQPVHKKKRKLLLIDLTGDDNDDEDDDQAQTPAQARTEAPMVTTAEASTFNHEKCFSICKPAAATASASMPQSPQTQHKQFQSLPPPNRLKINVLDEMPSSAKIPLEGSSSSAISSKPYAAAATEARIPKKSPVEAQQRMLTVSAKKDGSFSPRPISSTAVAPGSSPRAMTSNNQESRANMAVTMTNATHNNNKSAGNSSSSNCGVERKGGLSGAIAMLNKPSPATAVAAVGSGNVSPRPVLVSAVGGNSSSNSSKDVYLSSMLPPQPEPQRSSSAGLVAAPAPPSPLRRQVSDPVLSLLPLPFPKLTIPATATTAAEQHEESVSKEEKDVGKEQSPFFFQSTQPWPPRPSSSSGNGNGKSRLNHALLCSNPLSPKLLSSPAAVSLLYTKSLPYLQLKQTELVMMARYGLPALKLAEGCCVALRYLDFEAGSNKTCLALIRAVRPSNCRSDDNDGSQKDTEEMKLFLSNGRLVLRLTMLFPAARQQQQQQQQQQFDESDIINDPFIITSGDSRDFERRLQQSLQHGLLLLSEYALQLKLPRLAAFRRDYFPIT